MREKEYQYTLKTDGACAGNPGVIGIGGTLRNNETGECAARFSEQAGRGTNNVAEYLAIIKGLEIAKGLCPKSLLVCADSELAICQIVGEYAVRQDHLHALFRKVERLVRELDCPIRFMWIPRTQNSEADALASQASGMPVAKIDKKTGEVKLWEPDADHTVDPGAYDQLPKPNELCQKGIERLNRMGDAAKFNDYASVKTGGMDKYSRLKPEQLYDAIRIRFGESSLQWLVDAVGEADDDYSAKVFKWAARGLNPDLAMKKVSVDSELAANAMSKQMW